MLPLVSLQKSIEKAVYALQTGGIIAYPTESVYGLGCDPDNCNAVARLLQIKNRSLSKGFILVAAHFSQVEHLVEYIEPKLLAQVLQSWPGPITWLFPAKPEVPHWIKGQHQMVAIRVSDHPVVQKICEAFDGPMISTSANVTGCPPACCYRTACMGFNDQVDVIIDGQVGDLQKPTMIKNAITGEVIREG